MMAAKIEIAMKKSEPMSWARLDLPPPVPPKEIEKKKEETESEDEDESWEITINYIGFFLLFLTRAVHSFTFPTVNSLAVIDSGLFSSALQSIISVHTCFKYNTFNSQLEVER